MNWENLSNSSSKDLIEAVKPLIKRLAAENAVRHGGKAESGAVMGKVAAMRPDVRPIIKDLAPIVAEICREVSALSQGEQGEMAGEPVTRIRSEQEERKLPPLPSRDRYKEIRTRFAPNPNSVLHLGSSRPAILSHDYAAQYGGKFILRFEDTDPRIKRSDLKFYDYIREDLRWLGCEWDEEYIQSDRMKIYYEYAEAAIRGGSAYVCTCSQEKFKELTLASKACPCRGLDAKEQLGRFREMVEGGYKEGSAVLRVKTDLDHPNPAVRDWPAMRIIDPASHAHPRVGSDFRVWPLYNWASAIDDHLMGITHIIRGQEHTTNAVRQMYLYAVFGWEYPTTLHCGRLTIEGGSLSKSEIEKGIRERAFDGYDDLRLGTLVALRRRGIEAQAIRKLVYELGVKPSDAVISWDNLFSINRKLIDGVANRYFAIIDSPVRLVISDYPYSEITVQLKKHPDRAETRHITVKKNGQDLELWVERSDIERIGKGNEFRLMGLANAVIAEVDPAVAKFTGNDVSAARGKQHIHWLPISDHLELELVNWENGLQHGMIETNIASEQAGSHVQLERKFFAVVEKAEVEKVKLIYTSA